MRNFLGRVLGLSSSGTVTRASLRAISQNRHEDLLWLHACLGMGHHTNRRSNVAIDDILHSVSECVRTLAEDMFERVAAVGDCNTAVDAGFSLSVQPSNVGGDAGDGLFMVRGTAKPGDLVAIYPGSVFYAEDVDFFGGTEAIFPNVKEREHFILRGDGILLDGQYKSLDFSQSFAGAMMTSDGGDVESTVHQSMLERIEELTSGNPVKFNIGHLNKNPFALAHKANHPPSGQPANVIAVPVDFDLDLMKTKSPHLLPYLPTCNAVRLDSVDKTGQKISIASPSTVCFVASRIINAGEEIYLDYATSPGSRPDWMATAFRAKYTTY